MVLPPTLGDVANPKMELCQIVGGMMRQDLSLSSDLKDPLQSSGSGCEDRKQQDLQSTVPVPVLEGTEEVHRE